MTRSCSADRQFKVVDVVFRVQCDVRNTDGAAQSLYRPFSEGRLIVQIVQDVVKLRML